MTKTDIRLNTYADDVAGIADYFQVRSQQLRPFGFVWTGVLEKHDCGYTTTFQATAPNGLTYNSFYMPNSLRANGRGPALLDKCTLPILTMPDCGITGFLRMYGKEPTLVYGPYKWSEYRLISGHYLNKRARRTGQFYMQHIDEGLFLLTLLGADDYSKRAYCIHPILQDDAIMAKSLPMLAQNVPAEVLMLAMEYRGLANAYLPMHTSGTTVRTRSINVGVLEQVKHMLIADKIQNFKDFLLHKPDVGRTEKYIDYFNSWLLALGMPASAVTAMIHDLNTGDFVGNGKVKIVEKTS